VNGHDPACLVRENEHVAWGQVPDVGGCILNRGGVPRRHQRFETGKTCEQFRRGCKADFALALKILEDNNGIMQVVSNLSVNLKTNASAHHPERRQGNR